MMAESAGRVRYSAEAFGTNGESCERFTRPTKLFVGGITRHTTTKELRDHFSRYGRVLDCVAMRQPDGRSRGFGYVTLDSPDSADHAMSEPQVIDGRTVDMKRAVPEGSGNSPADGLAMTKGMQEMSFREPIGGGQRRTMAALGQPAYRPWAEAQYPYYGSASPLGFGAVPFSGSNLFATPAPMKVEQVTSQLPRAGATHPKAAGDTPDCVQLLSRRCREASAMNVEPARVHERPVAPGPLRQAAAPRSDVATIASATLSATATEFVPKAHPSLAPKAPPPPSTEQAQSTALRRPLGELPDVTNIIKNQVFSKPDCILGKEEKPKALVSEAGAGIPSDRNCLKPATGLATEPVAIGRVSHLTMEIREDSGGEDEDSQVSASCPQTLPSFGSADHLAGTCKRCNFFAKGRCQNGQSCTFCHFPHFKRKPSRQERGDVADDDLMDSESADSENEVQQITAYSVLPGLPPIRATALPALLHLPGNEGLAAASGPVLPPGLAPVEHLDMAFWQPDEEFSPMSVSSPLNAMPVLASSPHGVGTIFSTVPWAASVPQSLASSPTNTTAPSTILNEQSSGPQTPHSILSKLSPVAAACLTSDIVALTSVIVAAASGGPLNTIGTQTAAGYSAPCSVCCDDAASDEKRQQHTWMRDDLLRLKSAMGEDAADQSPGRLQAKKVVASA